jgi:hypothetical protein
MRTRVRAVLVLSGCLFGSEPLFAESDSGTYVVIPGRPDVPVIVNPYGFDASYSIVEGDFGLNKPAMVYSTIVAGPGAVFAPGPRRHYFPISEELPGYGRLEILPPPGRRAQAQAPAQSYHRSWSAASDPLPASTDPASAYPMTINPVVGPWGPWQNGRDHRRFRGGGGGGHGRR